MESILVGVNNFFAIFSKISSFLWSFPTQFSGWKSIPVLGQFTLLVLLLLGAGIWFTIKTGFVQIKNFKKGIKILSQKKSVEIGISPFASFMLSSAMRIGAGNITGVTGAIAVGGPGALFWMWLSAFFGMATAFVEATLSQIFKERKGDEYVGGLTHYAEKIFRNKHWVGISIAIAFLFYRLLCTRGDELHGLGAADMKGGLAAQLTVLRRFKEENASFDADIEFVGLSDEERHSIGAHAYVKLMQQQNALRKKNFFLMGEPHFDNIVIGATGKALLSLRIQGKEGHASTPETGINAIDCMARFLTAVQEKYMPLYANGVCASYCCLKIESDYAGYSLTIPSKCSALMNKQLFPTESIDSFIDDLQRIYAEKVCVGNLTICREIPSYPAYQLSPEQSDVQRLISLLRKQFGHAPELRINQSVSDGNILYNELSIPTVLFGPHGVAFHTECEYVKISSLSQYMDELYAFIKQEYTR